MTVLRRLIPVGVLGLVLAALCAVAAFGDDWVLADARPVVRTDFEQAPVSDDPAQQYGNEYYRKCLERRESGDLRCGETCFWRECVECHNICRMHCSCDSCPEEEDDDDDDDSGGGGDGGGGSDNDDEDYASVPVPAVGTDVRVVDISYAASPAREPEVGNECSLMPEIGYPSAGLGRRAAPPPVGPAIPPPAKPTATPRAPIIGVPIECDYFKTCGYLGTQIQVYDTYLARNFRLDFAGGIHHVLGSGLRSPEVKIERPFALTFVFQMGTVRDAELGVPIEGASFPCEVRWLDADSGNALTGLVYDSWYGPCYVGYGTHRQQGFIAEVRPLIGDGSLREDFRRWLWPTGHYRVELVMDPGTIHEYVISHRLFEIVDYDDPDENPFPAYLNEFSEIYPGCPDCTDCGCSSRYGCDCDADSDCGCECGGSCHCTSRCGSCAVWHWRGLGAVGSGRAPLVDRRDAGNSNRPAGLTGYWGGRKLRIPSPFGMSPNVQLLVDQHYGPTTRCRDVKGVLTDPQVFVDDAKWGVDDITPGEAGRYSWLEPVHGGRTPLDAQEDGTGPGPTQDRSYADGVEARELLRRKRFAVCEDSFRRELFKEAKSKPTGGNSAWAARLFDKVQGGGWLSATYGAF